MKKLSLFIVILFLQLTYGSLNSFSLSINYTNCFQSYQTDLDNSKLYLRMKALNGSFSVDNTDEPAKTLIVTIENVDPDFITISEGVVVSRGQNTLVFLLNVGAGVKHTVDIKPWHSYTNDFYFIAWSDNQDGIVHFPAKLLTKAALINPVISICAGDVTTATPPTIAGEGTSGTYPSPNDYMRDFHFQNYLELIDDYTSPIMEVPGNHDLSRGFWMLRNDTEVDADARYGAGQALWEKYLGPTYYNFEVGNTEFIMLNTHYDMPNWTKRFGGNSSGGYFYLGPTGYGKTLPDDTDGKVQFNWADSVLTQANRMTNRIVTQHHPLRSFLTDGNSVENARTLFKNGKVSYIISGHIHRYLTGKDGETGIPYLITGDANKPNPGFSLMHVYDDIITEQHILADSLSLSIDHKRPNDGTSSFGQATVSCSGYTLPFIRIKFKLKKDSPYYKAKDSTGASLHSYSHQFTDYTVVYVETAVANGQTKDVFVEMESKH